jgi:hypothetical protein
MKIKAIQQSIKNAQKQLKDSTLEWDVLEDTHIHLRQLYELELKALEELPTEPYKQSMQELYTVLTEAHDMAMEDTLDNIFSNNYVIPSHFSVEEIVEHLESMDDTSETLH